MTEFDDRYKNEDALKLLPPTLRDGLVAYIETGRRTGDFLRAVLCNDLRGACLRADVENSARLHQIVMYMHEYAPSDCWGEHKAVASWIGHEGFKGWPEAHRKPRDA